MAGQGDCGQPSSSGTSPTAGDCLFILRVAVGSATCSPDCICAPKGTLPTSASDALLCLRKAVGQVVELACPCSTGSSTGDDFNDDSKDAEKWGTDEIDGNGLLHEVNQRLEYSCSSATDKDNDGRPWILDRLPYDAPWEVQLDVVNLTASTVAAQSSGFGINIRSPFTAGSEMSAELYMQSVGYSPANGFHADLETDAAMVATADTGQVRALYGAIRMTFDSSLKVIHVFYDLDHRNGYQWTEYGSFGLAGSGGADGNTSWGMESSDTFAVFLYGSSSGMAVATGKMWGDNFSVTGGVAGASPAR